MFNLPKEIVIWDSEFTSWPGADERGWSRESEFKELVQIGAVRVRTSDFTEIDQFEVLIKPKVSPVLSDYFVQLTGISQAEVNENGLSFKKASQMFFNWAGLLDFYSWGFIDYWALAETCKINRTFLPIKRNRFFDIRMIFWKAGILAENYQSSSIVKAFGKKSRYRSHTGLNDARTILDGLRELRVLIK